MGSDISRSIDTSRQESDYATRPQAEKDAIVRDLGDIGSVREKIDAQIGTLTRDRAKQIADAALQLVKSSGVYDKVYTIASGDFASVNIATNTKRNKKVAFKIHVVESNEEEDHEQVTLSEGCNASALDGALSVARNIVLKVKHRVITSDARYGELIFYEVDFPAQTLAEQINVQKTRKVPFNVPQIRKVFKDVASGLLTLHLQNRAQVDFTPENIYYFEDVDKYVFVPTNPADVVDSLSLFSGKFALQASKQPNAYSSPEFFRRDASFNQYKSDVFSFGVILLELLAGHEDASIPSINSNQDSLKKVLERYSLQLEGYFFKDGKLYKGFNVLRSMLDLDEQNRIDMVRLCLMHDCVPMKYPLQIITSKEKTPTGWLVKYLDGFSYEGPLENDLRNGRQGTLFDENKNVYYRGDWHQGNITGNGMLCLSPFVTIEGEFLRGRINGNYVIKYKKPVEIQGYLTNGRIFSEVVEFTQIENGSYALKDIDTGLYSLLKVANSDHLEIFLDADPKAIGTLVVGKQIGIEEFIKDPSTNTVKAKMFLTDFKTRQPRRLTIHSKFYSSAMDYFFSQTISPALGGAGKGLKTRLNLDDACANPAELTKDILKWRPFGAVTEICLEEQDGVSVGQILEQESTRDLTKLKLTNIGTGGIAALNVLAGSSHITKLEELTLGFSTSGVDGRTITETLTRVVNSNAAGSIKRLEIRGWGVTASAVRAVVEGRGLRSLTHLAFANMSEKLETAFQNNQTSPPTLTSLAFENVDLGKALEFISLGSAFNNLEAFSIAPDWNGVDFSAWTTFFEGRKVNKLKTLKIGTKDQRAALDGKYYKVLETSTQLHSLTEVHVYQETGGAEAAIVGFLKKFQLKTLYLRVPSLNDDSFVRALLSGNIANTLEKLWIAAEGGVPRKFWTVLASGSTFKGLKHLEIQNDGGYVDSSSEPILAALADANLKGLETLIIGSTFSDKENFGDFFDSNSFPALRRLEFEDSSKLKDKDLKVLGQSALLRTLKNLKLSSSYVTDASVQPFFEQSNLTGLESFEFNAPLSANAYSSGRSKVKNFRASQYNLSQQALRANGDATLIEPLAIDEFRPQEVGPNTITRILRAKAPRMRVIEVTSCRFTNDKVLAKLINKLATDLTTVLRIKDVQLDNYTPPVNANDYCFFRDIGATGRLKNVTEISISNFGYRISLPSLFNAAKFEKITRLEIQNTELTMGYDYEPKPEDTRQFFSRPCFATLRELIVAKNPLIDFRPVFNYLTSFPWARSISSLSLKGQNIPVADIRRIFGTQNSFPVLEELDLSGYPEIDQDVLHFLASREHIPNLKILVARNTGVDEQTKIKLRAIHNLLII